MERRFEIRKHKILQEAKIKPQVFNGMLKRLEQFAQPFIDSLDRREQKEHAHTYIAGLLSDLKRKNIESIAYRHDQDRRGLQRFIGSVPWDHGPLLEELARQAGSELGEGDGVIVFDLGTLDEATTYYWRIDEVGAANVLPLLLGPDGAVSGEVWRFFTPGASMLVWI